jgi:hypothetical protein
VVAQKGNVRILRYLVAGRGLIHGKNHLGNASVKKYVTGILDDPEQATEVFLTPVQVVILKRTPFLLFYLKKMYQYGYGLTMLLSTERDLSAAPTDVKVRVE